MTFICSHCHNDDPEGVYVEHAEVKGVCTDCVHNDWIKCDQCEALIGPDDEHHEVLQAEGVFCSDECAADAIEDRRTDAFFRR
jgi:hypothetical protein